ncbi:SapB/AmfS family lanthipeptide [Streptomyces sp. TLI_146]|nr:hypothetical protein BX283_7706 [Streptomyces sp. TLI_146]
MSLLDLQALTPAPSEADTAALSTFSAVECHHSGISLLTR